MPDTVKLEQWPVQSQPTHRKCKGDETGDTSAADMKQYLVSQQGRKQITRTMACSKSTANASGSCKQNDTNVLCWWHWACAT